MKITNKEVEHVAKLAKLNLTGRELSRMTGNLDSILSYVAKLDELDTTEVIPTTHAFSINNAFRDDEMQNSLSRDEALLNAPLEKNGSFVVPKII